MLTVIDITQLHHLEPLRLPLSNSDTLQEHAFVAFQTMMWPHNSRGSERSLLSCTTGLCIALLLLHMRKVGIACI